MAFRARDPDPVAAGWAGLLGQRVAPAGGAPAVGAEEGVLTAFFLL